MNYSSRKWHPLATTDGGELIRRRVDPSPSTLALLLLSLLFVAARVGAQGPVQFEDVTEQTGITFQHTDGSSGKRYVIESVTGGVALFDYDLDGAQDVYFLNGAPLSGTHVKVVPKNAMYRNRGDWRFTDATEHAAVGDIGYGVGVAAADYDNDGFCDLYVNNIGPNVLYRNNGDGTFAEVTEIAGVAGGSRVGAGVCFFDMDADGRVDLYVANYLQFSYAQHRPHTLKGLPAYPSPLNYAPEPDQVYRNRGDGTFADVSTESGVAAYAGSGMGVVCSDYDDDSDVDVFVGNDLRGNYLFQNDGSGRFTETALLAGTAFDLEGRAQATMGVDAGDFNNDGLFDFHVTSFSGELATLYRNLGSGLFEDATRVTGAGDGTFPHVTWGNAFADFDNDGTRDLFIACGHVEDNLDQPGGDNSTAYRVPNVLLMNTGQEKFADASLSSGIGRQNPQSSRGLAVGDLDNDGDEDVVILNSRESPTLLRNDTPRSNHWVTLRLVGTQANRNGIGAKITLHAGNLVQVEQIHSGRGYQSHFGSWAHFGLRDVAQIRRIQIRWPGGALQTVEDVPADQILTIVEGHADTVFGTPGK